MATTTFSGPIKAGTIRNTTGTTVGTDVANSGFVTMAQAAVIALQAFRVQLLLPPFPQILRLFL
jgi:hypothetical protein